MLVDIPPFLAYVRAEYLHDHKEGQGYFVDATIYALASSNGEHLKVQIMVDGKTIFSRIPIAAIANSKTAPRMNEEKCVFEPCPDDSVSIIAHEYLASIGNCGVLKKDGSFWQVGSYVLTLEWPKARREMHLIELADGNFVVWDGIALVWGDVEKT